MSPALRRAAILAMAAIAAGSMLVLAPGLLEGRHLTKGRNLYAVHCASCHGRDLEGQPNWQVRNADGLLPAPPHDELAHTWHHDRDLLVAITKYGVAEAADLEDYRSAMPAFDDVLDDDEIEAVIDWIASTWPNEIRTRWENR
ncbi:c-type cytochrome [Shinella sp.]|uniref:c-type cytochrome n=1 Tax=Shinella sp. TaxID=1870904 RepID=UPI003F6F7FE1